MAALRSRCGHSILTAFLLSSFFSLFLAYYQRSQTVCLPYFHTWCGPVRIWNAGWNALHAARWKYRSGHKTYAKKCCLRTIAQLWRAMSSQIKHAPIIGIKLVKQQYLLRMSSQYGELRPTSGWDRCVSLGTLANSNGFRVLASLLHRRRSTEANQTLHDVWPSRGLVQCLYIFGGSCPLRKFCQVQ